jgi:SAM-dependent methyltransferase
MRRSSWQKDGSLQQIRFNLAYLFRPRWDTGISPPELLEHIRLRPPGAAIDLGCGTGTNVIALASAGWRPTGVDFSPIAIRRAQRRLRQAGFSARLLSADVTRPLPELGRFDLALDIGCFHTLSHREAYLENLVRLLGVGGEWLLYGFLHDSDDRRAMGLSTQDLEAVRSCGMLMRRRENGFDRGRPSAWFLFEKTALPPRDAGTHRTSK